MNQQALPRNGQRLFGVNELKLFAKHYKLDHDKILNFHNDNWPFPLPDDLHELLNLNSNRDASTIELNFLQCASAYYHLPLESVIATANPTDAVEQLIQQLPVQRILTVEPAKYGYQQTAVEQNKEWIWFPGWNGQAYFLPVENIAKKLQPGDLVILNHPNDPTGQALNEDDISTILQAASENNAYTVVDETYIELIATSSIASWIFKFRCLIVLRSLSHFFGIENMGVMLAHPEAAETLKQSLSFEQISENFLNAAAWALTHSNLFEHFRPKWLSELNQISQALQNIPTCKTIPTHTVFQLFQMPDEATAEALQKKLAQQNIFIPNLQGWTELDATYFRLCARDSKSNQTLITAIQSFAESK